MKSYFFYCGARDHEVDEDQHDDEGFGGLMLVRCDERKRFENVELLMMVMVVMIAIALTIVAFFVIEPIEKGKER